MKKKTLSALVSAVVVSVAALLGIPIYEEATTPEPTVSTVAPATDGSFLMVHTIDVGQADCLLIECDGQTLQFLLEQVMDEALPNDKQALLQKAMEVAP